MKVDSILRRIRAPRVLPIAVVQHEEDGCRLADALLAGGIKVLEITLRTPASREALRMARRRFPELLLGAGTILDAEVVQELVDDGIDFGVSPGLDEATIQQCAALEFPLFPGVMTPSEVTRALALGCSHLKFFPAESAGGANGLKALAAPFKGKNVSFVPTGGITVQQAEAYWNLPEVDAVGGSWLVASSLQAAGRYNEVTRLAKEALALSQET